MAFFFRIRTTGMENQVRGQANSQSNGHRSLGRSEKLASGVSI
jgi:hypothetical protein